MRKKALSLALALAMCLGLMAVPASAASATIKEIVSSDAVQSSVGGDGRIGALNFSDGVAWIGNTAIDTTGKVLIKSADYAWVGGFSEGVAWAKRDRAAYAIDKNGQVLFNVEDITIDFLTKDSEFHEGLCKVFSDGYFYLDKTGKVAIPSGNSVANGGLFCEGLAACYDFANAYYGYMDKTGKVVIPYQYSEARDFADGVAEVQLGNRWTIIDKTGKDLLPQEYSLERSNYSGVISPQVVAAEGPGSSRVFINRAGQVVSSGYYSISGFVDGMAKVEKNSREYGFVNEAGVLVIPCDYRTTFDFRDGFTAARREYDSAAPHDIFDKTGKIVGTINGVSVESNAGNGCFSVWSNESGRKRYGFVDYTGKQIVPCKYAEIKDFSGGVAAVKTFDQKWGFVNTDGTEIVPCQYKDVGYSNEPGIFTVKDYDNQCSILKSSGWTAPATPSTPTTPSGTQANPTNDKLTSDGVLQNPTVYKIGDSNYFKIRDLAAILNGTEKQFSVGYDNEKKSVTATTGQGYTKLDGDLAGPPAGQETAEASSDAIYVNGQKVEAEVYKIGGNNYFKLRDLGKALNFYVGWSQEQGMFIDTSKPYSE